MTIGQQISERLRGSYRPHHDCDCWSERITGRTLADTIDRALNREREDIAEIVRRLVFAAESPTPADLFIFGRLYDMIRARRDGAGAEECHQQSIATMLADAMKGKP